MRRAVLIRAGLGWLVLSVASANEMRAAQAAPPGKAAPAPAPAAEGDEPLYELGRQLFEDYVPAEIKAQLAFPTPEEWDAFGMRLQRALEGESLDELAAYLPEARLTQQALRAVPGYEDYADWLKQRIDELEGADEVGPRAPKKSAPALPKAHSRIDARVPHYDLWLARVRGRPLPARAAALMPRLRAAFAAEGVPPELAWLAEAESSLNPAARSPVGAKGLFQFMPETAKSLGLSTVLPDQRTDPDKSAQAAARYLRKLYARFGDWPLALAAYNAGEGRVGRALTRGGGSSFAQVAAGLPAETRMYVPKVYALIALRTGGDPGNLPPPKR